MSTTQSLLVKADLHRPFPSVLHGARRLGDSDWFVVPVEGALQATLDTFSSTSGVTAVAPNDIIHLGLTDESPASIDSRQWGLKRVGAPEVWDRTRGEGVTVAVLDTGVDTRHPALAANLVANPDEIAGNGKDDDGNGYVDDVHGANTVERNGNVADGGEHGTHVAGIVAADGPEVKGVAPKATLLPIKIFDNNGNTDVASVIEAFHYAETRGARIINCSWGGAPYNQALFEAMRDTDALIVCSSGNRGHDNDQEPHYPSGFELPNVLAVAATNQDDGLSFISNYGARTVDLAAPGVQILSTVPGARYEGKTGTSMAAPHASGAAALLASLYPQASAVELKARTLAAVDLIGGLQGKVAAGGILDLSGAALTAGHGPHLLGEFEADFQASLAELRAADNTDQDRDPRPGFVQRDNQRAILGEGRLALSELSGTAEELVWLEGGRQGDEVRMRQDGFERYQGRYYEYPLYLEGGPNTPFDPPDAEVSSQARYDGAMARFEREWSAA